MEYADKQKQFGDCCVCESAVERKRRTLILGPTQPARSVMKSLQFFLKEERNEDIDDTRLKSLSEKDHICHSCKNRIIKYAEYTNKRREIVEFLDRHIPRRKSVKLEVTPISPHTRPASTTEQPRSTALSMYPNDHDPPPAPTDVPHSQSGYGELSEADMMRNSSLVTNMVQAAGGHHAHTGCPPPLQNANSGRAQIPTGGPGSIPGGHEPQPVVNPANTASPILNGVPGAARSGQSRLLQPAAQVADLQEGDSTLSSQDDGHDLRKELLNNAGRSPCATLLPSTTVTTSQLPPLTKMVDTGPEPTSVPLVAKGSDIPKEVEDVIQQVQTQAQAQAMPPSSRAKAPPLPSGGTAGCTPVGTDGTKPAVPVDPTHALPVVSSAHSGSPSPGGVTGVGSGWGRPQQPGAQLAYQQGGGAKGLFSQDELILAANEFLNTKLLKGDGTTPNPTPPPSTTANPQSSTAYNELSEADMMWNKYANPKQQQQPTTTLNAIVEVLNKFQNNGSTQTPTGGPGSIPGGVVTSPTSYPTPQYHAPAPTAGVSPHHQQYYNMQPQGTIPVSNAQQQQTVQIYQQRRMGEGHPAHQQYLATAHQQQQHAAVVATQYQREQFAVTQQQQHQHERLASHHHMQFSDPANQNMGVQIVPMVSSFHGVLERGSPNVMTQSAPMNCTQPTYTMQQQLERGYVAAHGHAPQVQMMAQAHETIYQHPGMGQQVLQPLQTGGQHGYQTLDGRTHMLQAEQQQQQLYAQTQQSSFGGHFGVGGHPRRVLYTSGEKRGIPSDLAAYDHEVAAKQIVIAHPQGMMGVPQAPVQQMVQQPVGMVQHAAGMVQQTCTILHTSQC